MRGGPSAAKPGMMLTGFSSSHSSAITGSIPVSRTSIVAVQAINPLALASICGLIAGDRVC